MNKLWLSVLPLVLLSGPVVAASSLPTVRPPPPKCVVSGDFKFNCPPSVTPAPRPLPLPTPKPLPIPGWPYTPGPAVDPLPKQDWPVNVPKPRPVPLPFDNGIVCAMSTSIVCPPMPGTQDR